MTGKRAKKRALASAISSLLAAGLTLTGLVFVESTPSIANVPECPQTLGTPSNATVTKVGSDCVVTFSANTTWTVPQGVSSIRLLVVGGGAGGQGDGGGGGGGGGGVTKTSVSVSPGAVAQVVIGAGGSAGSNGGNTTLDLNGDSTVEWTASGGFAGTGWVSRIGGDGGSPSAQNSATILTGGRGGNGPSSTSSGTNATNNAMGDGFTSDITGSTLWYGGGGGGGMGAQANGSPTSELNGGDGGKGGGGRGAAQRARGTNVTWTYRLDGSTSSSSVTLQAKCAGNASYPGATMGFPGLNGYGGGGGGGVAYGDGCAGNPWDDDGERTLGGRGGNGVAIFRYPVPPAAPIISGITPSNGQLSVAFSNSSTVTNFEYSINNGASWVSVGSTSSPFSISGLANETSYTVLLRGINGTSVGAQSSGTSATPFVACSPTTSTSGPYTIVSFSNTGTCRWTVPSDVSSIETLVVGAGGGGGAGGFNYVSGRGGGGGGGGGGGQVQNQTISSVASATVTVTIGSAGAGGTTGGNINASWAGTHGRAGQNSVLSVNGTTITSQGGGAGFGGGFWGLSSPTSSICNNTRPFNFDGLGVYYIDGIGGKGGNSGNGNLGGRPYCDTGTTTGLGGAGAGGAGSSAASANLSAVSSSLQSGGAGTTSSITGSAVEYGTGGSGGGGEGGGQATPVTGAVGARAGMGGNGGAGSAQGNNSSVGAQGGSGANGLVVIRYAVQATVTYNLGGGTGSAPTESGALVGGTFTVASSTGITKSGETFVGWSDGANIYQPGSTYAVNSNSVTLTAVWTKLRTSNLIVNLDASRPESLAANSRTWKSIRPGTSVSSQTGQADVAYSNAGGQASLVFDGLSDHFEYTSVSDTRITGQMTVEMWVKPGALQNGWNILASRWFSDTNGGGNQATAQDWHFSIRTETNASALRLNLYTTNNSNLYGSKVFAVNSEWVLVGFTIDASNNLKFYVNGKQDGATIANVTHISKDATKLFIADPRTTGTIGFPGRISKFRLYDAALSANEMLANFDAEYDYFGLQKVTFHENVGGASTTATQYVYEATATALSSNSFTRSGYTFAGWNTAADGTGTAYANLGNITTSVDVTLYAQWTINTYNVTYDEKGGSSVSDATFSTGGSVTLPAAPTKAGFIFGGWSATDGGSPISSPYSPGVTSSITIYAIWLGISPPTAVTATTGNQSVTVGWTAPANSASQPPTAYRVEYSTTGTGSWTTADATISSSARSYQITGLTNNTAYYVRVAAVYAGVVGAYGYPWTLIFESTTPYRVSNAVPYTSNNGLADNDITLTRTDFSRVRYYVGVKYASGDATRLYVDANFDKVIANSATGGDTYTNLYRLQVPTITGGTFSQFEIHGNVSELDVISNYASVTQGKDMSGRLEIWPWDYSQAAASGLSGGNRNAFVFDDGDSWTSGSGYYGSFQLHNIGSSSQTIFAWNKHFDPTWYEIGFGTSPRAGSNPDWTFEGGAAGYTQRADFLFQSYANLSVTPIGSYTVTLNKGANGIGSDQTLTKTHSEALTLPNSATANSYFTRAGYTVTGWTTTDGGSQTHSLGGSFTTDAATTLYPVWTGNTYTVTYTYNSADGGVRPGTSSYTVGGSAITLPTPTRTGYTFDGWYAEVGLSTFVGAAGASYSPASSATIYAKWISTLAITTPNSGLSGTLGQPFSLSISTSGGSGTNSFAINGALQSGLSLNSSSGVISGTPSASGNTSVSVTVTDSSGAAKTTSSFTISINLPTCNPSTDTSSAPGYTILKFTSTGDCSWVVPAGASSAEVLIVAGGGGGAFGNNAGGGGAGEVLVTGSATLSSGTVSNTSPISLTPGSNVTITVGSGGTSGAPTGSTATDASTYWACCSGSSRPGGTGGNSAFGSVTAKGGGGGGGGGTVVRVNGENGGSGGGGASGGTGGLAQSISTYTGWTSFKNNGAVGSNGGGGGAGAAPVAGSLTRGGAGITVLGIRVAGGGGGWGGLGSAGSLTDTVLGGNGRLASGTWGYAGSAPNYTSPGTANTGTGGGGGAPGGSGVVVVRYQTGYVITYNYDSATGGNSTASDVFQIGGSALTLPTPTKTGSTFAGWYEAADFSGSALGNTYSPTQSRTIYAKWSINQSTVTFNANDGSGSPATTTQSITNSSATALTNNSFTRTGYTFAGWNTLANGTGTNYTNQQSVTITGNLTLYAKWTANTYTVTYTYNGADGGTRPTTDSFTVGGSAITLPTPSRLGFVFGGWYAEVGLSTLIGAAGASYSPTADITLYAKWTSTLIVDLDATNSSSYSGLGTTWTNIAPGASPASATLDSAAMYSTQFGGVMNTTSNRKATTQTTSLTFDNSVGFTMEVWVRFNAVNTAQGVASYDGGGKYINFYKAGNAGMRWEVSTSNAVTDSTVVAANTWYHYVGTCKNNTAVLYRNGVQAASSTGRTCTTSQNSTFLVGNIQGIQMDGSVSLFRFYTSALTADEVLTRYNSTKSRTTFTVTYNYDSADGGNSTASATYANGDSAIVLPTPTKTNNTFAGWYSDAGKTVLVGNAGANYTPTGANSAITLYAKWTGNTSTVTFNANDGSGSPATSTQSISNGVATALTANAFTRTGYTFAGWNSLANGTGTNYTNQQSVTLTGNLTLYAKWTANTYTVTYTYNNADGGTRPTTDSFTVGGSTITLPTPTRTGYTFAGWYGEVGLSTLVGNAGASYSPSGNVTIYAKWTANSNTVTFKSNYVGGAVDSTQSIVTAVATGLTNNSFTRAGYVFSGWNTLANGTGTNYTDGQSVTLTGPITLYAKWAAGTYTITYNYNSATGGASAVSGNYTTGGAQLVLPVPTKTGYTFGGWYDDSGFAGSALASSITTTSSKTIHAKWTAATFTVLYEYNGATAGNSTASSAYTTASTTITLPTPTKTGYTFAGWYESSNFSGSAVTTPYTTSQNRSLYAKWAAVNYTVTYNANLVVSGNTITGTGSVPVNNNTYNIGQSFSVAANTGPLTRSGYTFAGWVTNEDGTGTAKNSGETITFGSANINLYPKWTANTYSIAYNLNGGSGDLTSAPTSWTVGNANVTLPSSGFTRTGYDFAGWSKTQGGSVINNSFNNIGNVTLYAAWTLKSISYTFDKGTAAGQTIASWPSNSSANFGTTITLPTPSNTVTINAVTYQFFGWEYSGTTYQPGSSFTLSETAPTFVAQWVRLYDVRYAYAGGSHSVAGDTDDECVTGGLCIQDQDINLRTAPTRAGYNFIGWRVQDTNTTKAAGALHRVIATGYLFYANWQAIDYDFSFNSSGGSESHASVTANIGQLVTMPNPGFRVGYTFAGWSPDNGSTKYTTGSTYLVGTASKAFVAYWTPNVYTVVYDWQGASGTPTPDASYTVGTGALTLPLIGDRTKDGYTFGGWAESPGGTAVTNFTPTANDVLYAIWNDGNYTLSYDGRGASAGSGQGSVNRGSSVTLPTPVRAGFVFNGWYDDVTAGNKVGNGGASYTPGRSKTLYARWVQNSLYGVDPATLESAQEYTASDNTAVDTTLTHNPTNTSARIQVPSGALPNGTKVNVQYFKDTDRQSNLIPGNNSYFFSVLVSWLSGTGTSATVPNTAAGKPITVTLNNPSIKAGAMVYMVIGEQVTELGRATQDETVTVQLTQDPEIVVAATAPGNPASIVASAGDQEATVSWAAPSTNGGAQIVSYTVTATPGNASCTTATTSCTVTGLTNGNAYTFSVVATNSVGSSSGANSLSITPALATYTVTFNANGGSNVSNGSFTSGGNVSEPAAPSRSGYTFDGWSTVQNSAASKVTFPYSPGVTNNITLYALWTQVQSSGGGEGSSPGPTTTPTPTPTVTPGPTAPPSQIGFKPTPPPTPVAETGPVGSIVGSTEKITVVADAPSEKIIATAGDWKLEIRPPVKQDAEKPVTEKLVLQFPVAAKAEIAGTGMQPNTTVEAWVFSQPRYIGTLKVGADGSFASSLTLPKDLLPGQHTLQIGSLNSQGRLVTISIPISIKGSVSVGTFRGFVAVFTKDLEGQELTAKIAGKWIRQNPVRKFKNFSYSRLVRLTGAGYDIAIDVYINKKFYKRYTTRTR